MVGTTGSGKSSLAGRLSSELNCSHISLDRLFWKPGWQATEDPEFFDSIKKSIASDKWVVDGNYTRTQFITWEQADTVIWIDLPFWLNFYQLFTRTLGRVLFQKELWEDTGNKESLRMMLSKDSILLWFFRTYRKNRVKYLKKMEESKLQGLRFVQLSSRREIDEFVGKISKLEA